MNKLPAYATFDLVAERLPQIFPNGTPQRNYCTRELAASTVFVMLYIGAVEGLNEYLGPVHVYRMTEEQAALTSDEDRIAYRSKVLQKNVQIDGRRWYADNTREPIRDETLRDGFVHLGAVVALQDVPTTSNKPRYYLHRDFAALFNPGLTEDELASAIDRWQSNHLSKSAQTRIRLASIGRYGRDGQVEIRFPNNEVRHLSAGPSSEISKAVIEQFAATFLCSPVVLWLSTSDKKTVFQDVEAARSIGLQINAAKNLPDIILADLAPEDPLLVFIEVVATDGAVTERRQKAIYEITEMAGFKRSQISFVTAYADRQASGFKKTISNLAWNTFAWFVSEPDKVIVFRHGGIWLSKLSESFEPL